MTSKSNAHSANLTLREVARFWWPLAASWMLMGFELPAVSAVIARLSDPKINLGAYGVVFSIALIIEAPIIMLLAASTALSKDWSSYVRLRRFMMRTSVALTILHALVAFTPLFDILMLRVINLPAELLEPARLGLRIMTPWTWAIAYRRFNQGVLIRFDHTRSVGIGTVVRLLVDVTVLSIGLFSGAFLGIAVGTSAAVGGVLAEAIYVGIRVRPVIRDELKLAPAVEPPLQFGDMMNFYLPLALTSFIALIAIPVGSAALSRAPLPIESLAVWPAMAGFIFVFRSLSVAFNEVVVTLLDRPAARKQLQRFALLLSIFTTLPVAIVAITPLSTLWFGLLSYLEPQLVQLARVALPLALFLPFSQAWISWFQGTMVHARRTRGITESVAINLVLLIIVLFAGVAWGQVPGIYITWVAFSVGAAGQVTWLWTRSRAIMRLDLDLAPAPAA